MPERPQDQATPPTAWRHPHDAFREGLSLYYSSTVRPYDTADTGRLLLGLWAYVEGIADGTPHATEFSHEWNKLTDLWIREGSASGVGRGMLPQEFEARQLILIVRFAKKTGIFETPDTSYTPDRFRRDVDKYGGSRR